MQDLSHSSLLSKSHLDNSFCVSKYSYQRRNQTKAHANNQTSIKTREKCCP